jgi:hypothetical protein
MNDGNKRRSSAELIPLFFSAVLLDIIPIHYCHNLYISLYALARNVRALAAGIYCNLVYLVNKNNAVLFRSPSCYPPRGAYHAGRP